MNPTMQKLSRMLLCFALLCMAASRGFAAAAAPAPVADWQRVTAHINGVFSPRGFFNILVGLNSMQALKAAQFNLGQSTVVLDFPPNSPPISGEEIQHIEKIAGYRPGPVEIQHISAHAFSETGPGWVRIKHPTSKDPFVRWAKQNF